MRIKSTLERIPGGLMVVPLLAGALVATIDKMHLAPLQQLMVALGVPTKDPAKLELLQIGGFTTALFTGTLTLIALFLFCSAAQMNLRIGGRALKKGLLLTLSKYAVGVAAGYAFSRFYGQGPGFLGLSTLAIIAAMTNSNGGMYVALTSQYGNRSDTGAIAVLSLNDGPFLTMIALGLLGEAVPLYAFVAVLTPILLGMLAGNLDPDLRAFLKPGETLTIPFFAFALGTTMNLATFANPNLVAGGVVLGVATTLLTGFAGMLVLRIFRERSVIAGMAEGSTAGNAAQTPFAIVTATTPPATTAPALATAAAASPFAAIQADATAQIAIACVTTALLCPAAVMLLARYQAAKGINAHAEPGDPPTPEAAPTATPAPAPPERVSVP